MGSSADNTKNPEAQSKIDAAIMGMMAAGGIMQAGGAYMSGMSASYENAASAEALRANANLGILNAQTQNLYLNEAASSENAKIAAAAAQLAGTQKATIAASGFDMSGAGDERLIVDTKNKERKIRGMLLKNTSVKAFENTRAARAQKIAMDARANALDIAAKGARNAMWVNAAGSVLQSGVGLLGAYRDYKLNKPGGK
jgi:hypothetical protein